jgi:glutamate racemase
VDDDVIAAEIAPCFVEAGGRRTDVVVMACTHYPLLIERLERLAPWPVTWLDPSEAIARRVVELLGPGQPDAPRGESHIVFTSGALPGETLAAALAEYRLAVT